MSHASRVRLILVVSAVALITVIAATVYAQGAGQAGGVAGQAQAVPEAFNPYAPSPYRRVPNWPPPDPGVKWGSVIQAEPDAQGNLWVLHRGTPPIVKLNTQSGRFLAGFGTGMFAGPHGFTLDQENNLYVSDCPLGPSTDEAAVRAGKGYQVSKMSPDGRVLMTLGKAGVAKAGIDTFACPTDIAIAPNGDIFITDGHDATPTHYGDRVAKFSRDGKFIKDIAQQGTKPGQVWVPHSIALDSQGRLFVADRSNNRIQILDQDGNFIDLWKQFSRPSGIFIDKKTDTIYVADSESDPQRNPEWPRGIRIGSAKTGVVTFFISGTDPEGATVDAQGNVYGCVNTRMVLEKYERITR